MPEPYFKGQEPSKCGCYYPDVHFRKDIPGEKVRILHCIIHGEYPVPLGEGTTPSPERPIPSNKWYEEERERLHKIKD